MHFRFSPILAIGLIAVLPAVLQRARGEEQDAPDPNIAYRKKLQEVETKALEEREAGLKALDAKVKEMNAQAAEKLKPQEAKVTIDEQEITVKEPSSLEEVLNLPPDKRVRDEYEISPDDFDIAVRDHWSLNASDFRFDSPQYITAEESYASPRTWFGYTFSITNSTTKPRRIAPVFTAVTNRGARSVAVGGYIPERLLADASFRPLGGTGMLRDAELIKDGVTPLESVSDLITKGGETPNAVLKPAYTFEPGQTRWGAALWSEFDNNFSEVKIIVNGLNNVFPIDEVKRADNGDLSIGRVNQRRVLVLSFTRNSDGYNVTQSRLDFKGKRWEMLWMWDQDITVPFPADPKDPQIKAQKLQTPAGGERFVWAFPLELRNSTHTNQDISIKTVSFVCPVEVDIGGTKVTIDAKVVDDGRSSIYKAQLLKPQSGYEAVKDRYQNKALVDGAKTMVQRHTQTLEPGKVVPLWAAFDESDVNFEDADAQIELALSRNLDHAALAKQNWEKVIKESGANPKLSEKPPLSGYIALRKLTPEEASAAHEQIRKALPDAVEKAKQLKTVTAVIDAEAGLASGENRISRTYKKPGDVLAEWLTAWETVDKE